MNFSKLKLKECACGMYVSLSDWDGEGDVPIKELCYSVSVQERDILQMALSS